MALHRPERTMAQPHGYYWIPQAWGHTSSDASGGGPCRHATSVPLAADLTRTWAVAISGTPPDGEGVAPPAPPEIRRPQAMGPHGGRRGHSPPPAARGSQAGHGGPRGRGEGIQPDAPAMALGWPACARAAHRAPMLVYPSHLPPQQRLNAQIGLAGVPGHRPTEHAPGLQPRPAHSRWS